MVTVRVHVYRSLLFDLAEDGCRTLAAGPNPSPLTSPNYPMDYPAWVPDYNDVIMSAMASQITGVSIVCSVVCSFVQADQRKHQSSASLAFVRGSHRSPVDPPHKGLVTRKDVVMLHTNNFEIKWNYDRPFLLEMRWDLLHVLSRRKLNVSLSFPVYQKCINTHVWTRSWNPNWFFFHPHEIMYRCFDRTKWVELISMISCTHTLYVCVCVHKNGK